MPLTENEVLINSTTRECSIEDQSCEYEVTNRLVSTESPTGMAQSLSQNCKDNETANSESTKTSERLSAAQPGRAVTTESRAG